MQFVLCLVALFLASALGQGIPQPYFNASLVGSFRHSAIGTLGTCAYCDCPASCAWYDGVTCSAAEGPDDNQQRWGSSSSYYCFPQSGVGFQGVTNVGIVANDPNPTRVGKITHYNNIISGGYPTTLRLALTMTAPQLPQPFYIGYPLGFIETANTASISGCDPSIQRSTTPCDDRFSFNDASLTATFTFDSIQYTLEMTGFLQPPNTVPIKQFVTVEVQTTKAEIYGRIVTVCLTDSCGPNQLFRDSPICDCLCVLDNATCQAVFGPDWIVGDMPNGGPGCTCLCNKVFNCNDSISTPGSFQDRCACGCNLTDAYCQSINDLWGVTLDPNGCYCECNRQRYIDCYRINAYYRPVGTACQCECYLTDEVCQDLFDNPAYRADLTLCGCVVPPVPGDGLSDDEIAGIVVATVLGPILLIGLVALLAGILVYLIQAGIIPGIYGYKVEPANVETGSNSPIYDSPWTEASSALG